MARSKRLRELESRLIALKKHLLPTLSLTGSYTPRQYDRVRSYRVLVHAEVESCVEDIAREVVEHAYNAWLLEGKLRTCLIGLLSYCSPETKMPDTLPSQLISLNPGFLRARLESARKVYSSWLYENHGIKEKNLLKLLLPLGMTEFDFDRTWLATMNSFGQLRGETAHTTALAAQQPPDPQTELQTVEAIIKGLRDIDAKLAKL